MITELYIKNFRNLKDLEVKNISLVNTICGLNGSGKTNLLEYVLFKNTFGTIEYLQNTNSNINGSARFYQKRNEHNKSIKMILMDEFENGLHYTEYKEYLSKILRDAHKHKVQFFITTHSKEVLETLNEILKEDKTYQENFTHYILSSPAKDKKIAYNYTYDEFSATLGSDFDLRDN